VTVADGAIPGHARPRFGRLPPAGVLCCGAAVGDLLLALRQPVRAGTSNPATATTGPGGVARNVAENLARLAVPVQLLSWTGDDAAGDELRRALDLAGVGTGTIRVTPGASTARYVAVLSPAGELEFGLAAMDLLDRLTPADVDHGWPPGWQGGWVFADTNLPGPALARVLQLAGQAGSRVAVDAVSVTKAARLPDRLDGIDLLFGNLDEAAALLPAAESPAAPSLAARLVGRGAAGVVLTLGPDGALIADPAGVRPVPAVPARPVDVTGAGDALVAGTLGGILSGTTLDDAVRLGAAAAALTVERRGSVRAELSRAMVERRAATHAGAPDIEEVR
jgi:pseudouridine kinase